MRKLLSANFYSLWKNRVFWADIIFSALFSVYIVFANYSPELQATGDKVLLEKVFFIMYQIVSIVIAVGTSLFIGTEYSDGTIRNKLIIGHTREKIYFSMLITALVLTLTVLLVHGICTGLLGYILFGAVEMELIQFVSIILCAMLATAVYTAIFAAISMSCSNKAINAVICIIVAIALIFISGIIQTKLLEPEMTYDGMVITMDGIEFGDLIKNPAYLSGTKREIYKFLYDLLPSGQIIQIASNEIAHLSQLPIFSVILFATVTAVGILTFKRKDIK